MSVGGGHEADHLNRLVEQMDLHGCRLLLLALLARQEEFVFEGMSYPIPESVYVIQPLAPSPRQTQIVKVVDLVYGRRLQILAWPTEGMGNTIPSMEHFGFVALVEGDPDVIKEF